MSANPGKVYFYYPQKLSSASVPECEGQYEKRQAGNYIWTVKTFGYLKKAGCECDLTSDFPKEGIILTHRDFLDDRTIPSSRQLIVCIVADTRRHPYAQLHLLQNPNDSMLTATSDLWPGYYMPHWPETGLIPRNTMRGEAFENISYFGLQARLAPQLQSGKWKDTMRALGFNWRIMPPGMWNDYSSTDAVLAVRSFSKMPYYKNPATKLYNAWIAEVPALLGQESAYQAERRSHLDYIECSSVRVTIEALAKLRDDVATRREIIKNGIVRARDISPSAITARWERFIREAAFPAWDRWINLGNKLQEEFLRQRSSSYRSFVTRDFIYRGTGYLVKSLRARTWR